MKNVFLLVFLVLLSSSSSFADETESAVSAEVNEKLVRVMETQQQILKELEDIKSELHILKIRVSQNQ